MRQYLDALNYIMEEGERTDDRTGTGTTSVFGYQMKFDLTEGFPVMTTKKIHMKSVIHELLWMISGSTNIKYLKDKGVSIWDAWADEDGELGPIYGKQWRNWTGAFNACRDQLSEVIDSIKKNPHSRRHIVSAWNATDVDYVALPPCHCLYQFRVSPTKGLSCHMYQRSADAFLGVPFNIASYALLTMMVARCCDLEVDTLTISFGDLHIYNNHVEQVELQVSREPLALPKMLIIPEVTDIDAFIYEDFELLDYRSHPGIPAPISV